ncbi:MAG: PIG-L family deacetylase, partial [Candidatus Dormibacteraeota bacterium]|nr:PIG-L family deacetylase [Candidatus Dormibacteraeota bacterium]
DDESITMGGLLATCHDRGVRTMNICCTDGKLATIVAADMPEVETRPRLAEIRQAELRAACAILGVDEVVFLGYGDSGMWGEPTNDLPDAFWTANVNDAVGRVVEQIRRFRPHVVVTYDGVGGYGHPDHIQAHRVTLLAVEAAALRSMYPDKGAPWRVSKLYYTAIPLSFLRRAADLAKAAGREPPFGIDDPADLPFVTPDEWVTTHVDVRDTLGRKRQALTAHRSQIGPDWPMLAIPEEVTRQYFPDESFQLVISHVPTQIPESDVFAGVSPEDGEVPGLPPKG